MKEQKDTLLNLENDTKNYNLENENCDEKRIKHVAWPYCYSQRDFTLPL